MTFARSYVKTRNLEDLAARDPQIAGQVEMLCRAILALRGPAIMFEADSMLRFASMALEPFVEMVEPFDAAMARKASSDQAKAASARRKCHVKA